MLLNISLLDIWGSGNMVSLEAYFVLKHYFCLYTPNVDLGSLRWHLLSPRVSLHV